ncbi:MAG TPA: methyl-accepting chemotaxis protein [Salinarimonas sp.]|nr:methyl-accepting chemotaxis protein [Salinarimonas sp.]
MFGPLSIRAKLIGAFLALLCIVAGLGTTGIIGLTRVETRMLDISDNWLQGIRFAGEMNASTVEIRADLLRHILADDRGAMEREEQSFERNRQRLASARASYAKTIANAEEQALYDTFSRAWDGFEREVRTVLSLSRNGDKQKARDHQVGAVLPLARQFGEAIGKILDLNNRGADAARSSAVSTYEATEWTLLAGVALAFLITGALAWWIIRSIAQGIASVVAPMQGLARGDLDAHVPHRGEKTEIGTIADTVQVFKDALIAKKAADEMAAVENEAKMRRAQMLDQLTRQFEAKVSSLTQGLSSAATEMEATAQSMTATANQTNSQSTTVASAAEQTSTNVQTVAAATEELSISIQEITSQVAHSSKIAHSAVEDARRTDAIVQTLATTAEKIGGVIALINNVAGQTNLLALNATIEAARAGESGRGFAVVAAEVKELAGQTTKATEEIGAQIAEVQTATRQAVEAIQGIAKTIGDISSTSTAIAAAIEEQGAATQEIARNVQEAARGTEQVTGNIADVKRAAGETGAAASQVLGAAQELARHSDDLSREVEAFLSGVKAA